MTVTAVDINACNIELPVGRLGDGSPVWVEARPNLRRSYALAGDILAALGKRRDLAGKGRNQHEDITLAAIWLRARRTRDLVITDAQRLHPKILGTLCRLADEAEVDLWLLHRAPTSDAFLHALVRRSDATKHFLDVPPPVLAPPLAEAPAAPFPRVPRHDIHLFRAVCQQQVEAEDLPEVLALLDAAAVHAYERMSLHGTGPAVVASLLEEILEEAPDDDRLITAVRGLQLAAWHHDLFIRVDLDTLLHSEDRPRVPPAVVDRALTIYRQPHRALTCALTRRGHPLNDIAAIRLCDVTDGGRQILIAGQPNRLPDSLVPAARAAVLLREYGGSADPTDLLLPYATHTLAAVLTDANNDIGLHVKGRRAERTRPRHTAYLRRLGITLASLK